MPTIISLQCLLIFLLLCIYSPKLYHYSGIRLIFEKLCPSSNDEILAECYVKPSSFFLWTLSIYVTIFTLAATIYNLEAAPQLNRITSFQAQMATKDRIQASARIYSLQKIKVPVHPVFFNPIKTVSTFFLQEEYALGHELIDDTLKSYKDNLAFCKLAGVDFSELRLDSVNLFRAELMRTDLRDTDLSKADLRKARLVKSNLTRAVLSEARFDGAGLLAANFTGAYCMKTYFINAYLNEANFTNAILTAAKFQDANLHNTIFKNAFLAEADFENARNLTASQLKTAKNLYNAKLPISIKRELQKTHPQLFKLPTSD